MRLAKSLVASGEIELMSTTVLPRDSPSATPDLPNNTASTCGVSGTIVMITSLRFATSRPDSQPLTPLSVSEDGTGLRSKTCSEWPAVTRLAAMGVPMIPSPTNPTFMSCLSVLLLYRAAHRRYGFSRSELWRGGAAGLYSDRSVACRVKFRYKPRC